MDTVPPTVTDSTNPDTAPDAPASPDEAASLNTGGEGEGGDPGKKHEAHVPYERFNQVRQKLQTLEPWEAEIRKLAEDYKTPEDFRAALAIEQQRNQQVAVSAEIEREQQRLVGEYNQKIASGEITEDEARYAIKADWAEINGRQAVQQTAAERDAARREAADAKSRLSSIETDRLMESLRTDPEYSDMDEDWVLSKYKSEGGDLKSIAQKSHEKEVAKAEKLLAKYNAGKGDDNARPAPEGKGGQAVKAKQVSEMTDDEFKAFWAKSKTDAQKNRTLSL